MVQLPRENVSDPRPCGGQMGPAHKARDDGDCLGKVPCPPPSAKGAPLTSHGETIAGLSKSLKDRPPGGRRAATRSVVLD
ncbi:hypothetical protein CVUC_14800 [Caulobacter vibrioides]|nr:hypothetical protein CA608_20225 [Caulobacter vibrioides]PLR09488.1 hypothetical protein CVUC_14800 [Caulobacter vibrioides]